MMKHVIHTGIKVNVVDLDRIPNAANTALLHPDSCNQTSNLLTCARPSLLQRQEAMWQAAHVASGHAALLSATLQFIESPRSTLA